MMEWWVIIIHLWGYNFVSTTWWHERQDCLDAAQKIPMSTSCDKKHIIDPPDPGKGE